MASALKTSEQWNNLFRDYFTIDIESANGWNKENFHHSWMKERICINEFLNRMKNSGCYFRKNWEEVSACIIFFYK